MTPEHAAGSPASIVTVRGRSDPWCHAFERALDELGMPIALPHRTVWAERVGSRDGWFVGVADALGTPRACCAVEMHRVRTMPGHVVYRLPRFGHAMAPADQETVLRAVIDLARSRRNVLRLRIEAFAADAHERMHLERTLEMLVGATRVPPLRYTRTLRLDLAPTPEEVFAALPKTARRNLQAARRSGLAVRVIDDPAMAGVLAALEREAFARTGGQASATDWPALAAFARAHPRLVRIAGLFAEHGGAVPDLLGFATAFSHGDHVEYAMAGTTRRAGLKISLGYPLLWNLIEWTCSLGASWFDFGGITPGTVSDSSDALGGISDFKRHFGGAVLEVGDDWELTLRPFRCAVADGLSRAGGMLRSTIGSRAPTAR